ncbi:uncharacterized protein PGTG_07879 [Puccinia graminis f. sp. tritici CRL 75-36-700-3]|uniref:Uncharacterized protein n=1 Tax=Puccinia graminis f. sp. tritici (strain CRL 75-36-700-3 / race SCCL) TaxID=418459 RepID=E3KBB7_PUCGT|nr:uncharacterized protein PGTG_07879 [Puccinia graminis f. sp. tritici CRL 75-36-700-3]EFP81630.2 hypothetical protein PGTG_07879 [Puccinia graminis f. sp. tritici CRL 75-36-700-3]
MGLSPRTTWILHFLGLLGGTTSLFTADDVFRSDFSASHLDALCSQRAHATRFMSKYHDPPSLSTIGQKITGTRSEIFGYKSDSNHLTTGDVSELRKKLNKQILDPMLDSFSEQLVHIINLRAQTQVRDLLMKIEKHVTTTLSQIDPETPRSSRIQNSSQTSMPKLFGYFQDVYKLLKDDRNLWTYTSPPLPSRTHALNSIVFRLNDVLVAYLSAAEKYKLVGDDVLKNYLNEENEGMIIFHCIWGKFPPKNEDVTAVFVNFDLKLSLARSPFAEELTGLLKHLTPITWAKITRSYILLQLRHAAATRLSPLTNRFFTVTKSFNQLDSASDLVQQLTEEISRLSAFNPTASSLINLKFAHNMLHFLMQYHVIDVSGSSTSAYRNLWNHRQIQDVDQAILQFSDVLKSIYSKYGEVLQIQARQSNSRPSTEESQMIYLTDINNRNQVSSFSTGPQYDDQELFHHTSSEPSAKLRQNRAGIRDIVQSWRIREEFNSHPLLHRELQVNDESEPPELIQFLVQKSGGILQKLENIRLSNPTNTQDMLQLKTYLESILKDPVRA